MLAPEAHRAVFLSYASEDAAVAAEVCAALRSAGIDVWFDQSELRGGDAWDASIRQQIKSCALFIPLISRNTQARGEGYFRLEWKLAVDRSHLIAAQRPFLLPLVVDATAESGALVPDRFREVHWTRLAAGVTAGVFADQVARLLSHPGGTLAAQDAVEATAPPRARPHGNRLAWGLAAAVAVAVALFAIDRLSAPRHAEPTAAGAPVAPLDAAATPGRSIAVLAFSDLSPGHDQAYFSDGMAEEILNALSRIEGLTVAGRTSSFSFKGREVDLKSIGRALGVAHILEGSVRKQGERVRITAKLARARDGVQEWSHEYDGTLADIFGLQESIARDIAGQLKIVLADTGVRLAPKLTGNSAAYLLFVEAQDLVNRRTEFPRAVDLLKQATTLDPLFARAWSKLAVADAVAPMYSSISWAAGNEAGEAAAHRALALDPGSAESYAALGFIFLSQHRYADMDGAFDAALRLDPTDPVAQFWAANGLASMGRNDAAQILIDRILRSDPVNPTAYQYKSMLLLGDNDLSGAVQAGRRGVALGFPPAGIFSALAVAQRGDFPDAGSEFAASWGSFNTAFTRQELQAIFAGAYGSAPARSAAVALVEARIKDPLAPTMFIFLREPQKAFGTWERFNSGIADGFLVFLWMPADWSRYARQHASFEVFAKRTGMLEYWRQAGWPDLCHPAPARGPDAFDCK